VSLTLPRNQGKAICRQALAYLYHVGNHLLARSSLKRCRQRWLSAAQAGSKTRHIASHRLVRIAACSGTPSTSGPLSPSKWRSNAMSYHSFGCRKSETSIDQSPRSLTILTLTPFSYVMTPLPKPLPSTIAFLDKPWLSRKPITCRMCSGISIRALLAG